LTWQRQVMPRHWGISWSSTPTILANLSLWNWAPTGASATASFLYIGQNLSGGSFFSGIDLPLDESSLSRRQTPADATSGLAASRNIRAVRSRKVGVPVARTRGAPSRLTAWIGVRASDLRSLYSCARLARCYVCRTSTTGRLRSTRDLHSRGLFAPRWCAAGDACSRQPSLEISHYVVATCDASIAATIARRSTSGAMGFCSNV
jgi:hypothetical protein